QCEPELKDRVERLLAADLSENTLAPGGALRSAAAIVAQSMSETALVSMLGPYRIVGLIGAGGRRVCYKAGAGGEFGKSVAVKILPAGITGAERVERFRRERQILATLEHPNIARLLDGGTTDAGVPYLILEFVDGISLSQYAVESKLSIAERLRLFLQI